MREARISLSIIARTIGVAYNRELAYWEAHKTGRNDEFVKDIDAKMHFLYGSYVQLLDKFISIAAWSFEIDQYDKDRLHKYITSVPDHMMLKDK